MQLLKLLFKFLGSINPRNSDNEIAFQKNLVTHGNDYFLCNEADKVFALRKPCMYIKEKVSR